MTPQPQSPNWYWEQLGYTVCRNQTWRTVTNAEGETIYHGGTGEHERELAAAKQHYASKFGEEVDSE